MSPRSHAACAPSSILELGAHAEIVRLATRMKPFQATLVPEKRQEITTEGGLALRKGDRRLADAITRLKDAGIRVSLFIDPSLKTIDVAHQLGVPAIELHTGRYAHSWRRGDAALKELRRAAAHARQSGSRSTPATASPIRTSNRSPRFPRSKSSTSAIRS